MITIRLLYFLLMLVMMSACEKHRAKKLAGAYACVVDFHYQDGTPMIYDSTFYTTLNVSSNKNLIKILKFEIKADLVYKGEKYHQSISSHGWLDMLYKKREDSLYFYWQDGGQGGYGSYNYKCKKLH